VRLLGGPANLSGALRERRDGPGAAAAGLNNQQISVDERGRAEPPGGEIAAEGFLVLELPDNLSGNRLQCR